MTEDIETSTRQPIADEIPSAAAASSATGESSAGAGSSPQERAAAIANERPEMAVGAAFAGGFLFALILKRIAR